MKQIGFERHWLYMLDEYVRPIQEKLFIGYYKRVSSLLLRINCRLAKLERMN